MKTRLLNAWEDLRTSLWFVPSLMLFGAVALAFGTVALDAHVNAKLARSVSWLWSGSPDGARALLSAAGSSVMTVAGVVFSITVTSLTLASSQFGPRLLRNFMSDKGNQIVLGTFIATFVYCLLVLRTVRSTNEGNFVPYISVTIGMGLTVTSLCVLVYFIHHVAGSIQAENISAAVGRELHEAIVGHCEEHAPGDGQNVPDPAADAPAEPPTVRAEESGYLLSVDRELVVKFAAEQNLRVRLVSRPGDFVLRGAILAEFWSVHHSPRTGFQNEQAENSPAQKLLQSFSLGRRRTPTQDVRYPARQLVEVASRALSPGINDPFTATGCMDWLAAGLSELARRPPPRCCWRDEDGQPRLWEEPVSFPELVEACFEPIRAYSEDSDLTTQHLLKTLNSLALFARREEDLAALRRLVARVPAADRSVLEHSDLEGRGAQELLVRARPEPDSDPAP